MGDYVGLKRFQVGSVHPIKSIEKELEVLDPGGEGVPSAVMQGTETDTSESVSGWDEVTVGMTAVLLRRCDSRFLLSFLLSLRLHTRTRSFPSFPRHPQSRIRLR